MSPISPTSRTEAGCRTLSSTALRRERFEEADTLTRLGYTHHAAGDHDDARNTWEQAQTILEDLQHPDAENVRRKLKSLT
jgi:hypothetical protein